MDWLEELVRSGPIPDGVYHPEGIVSVFPDERYLPRSKRAVRESLALDEQYFEYLEGILGGLPPGLREAKTRFDQNKERVQRWLPSRELNKITPEQVFPFCEDFNGSVHQLFEGGLGEHVFTPQHFARGGSASLYADATHTIALKLFHRWDAELSATEHPHLEPTEGTDEHRYKTIRQNIADLRERLEHPPFIPIHQLSKDDFLLPSLAYTMDLVSGAESASNMWEDNTPQPDLVYRLLSTYAAVVEELHAKGKVFVDHKPATLIYTPTEVRVYDVDYISPLNRAPKSIGTQGYMSLAQLQDEKTTFSSDLQGFALAAHFILLGEHAHYKRSDYSATLQWRYHSSFVSKSTSPLGRLLDRMINVDYENIDTSVVATDFRRAIDQTFKA